MDKKNVRIEFFRNGEPLAFLLRKKGGIVQETVRGFPTELAQSILTAVAFEKATAVYLNGVRYSWTITQFPDAAPGEPEFEVGDTVHVRETAASRILGTANRAFVIAEIREDAEAEHAWNRWRYCELNGDAHTVVDAGEFNAAAARV